MGGGSCVWSICGLRLVGNDGGDLDGERLNCREWGGCQVRKRGQGDETCGDRRFCNPKSYIKWLIM